MFKRKISRLYDAFNSKSGRLVGWGSLTGANVMAVVGVVATGAVLPAAGPALAVGVGVYCLYDAIKHGAEDDARRKARQEAKKKKPGL